MSERQLVIPRLASMLLAASTLLPAPQLSAQQTAPTASLRGTVINAVTRQPIARALVSLDQYGQAMLTDNEGRFNFDSVPAGQATLSARRPGFSSDDSGSSSASRQAVPVPSTGDVTLALTPQSSITGELLFSGNDAPDTLRVQLLWQEIQNGRAHWSVFRDVEANSDGRFRFGNLPSGAYLVHIAASPDPAPALAPGSSSRTRSGYVPAFYPGEREISGAGILTLSPGQQASIRMELTRETYYPVVIPVANPEDARSVNFDVESDSFWGLPAHFSLEDGTVHIELPSGHYQLEAHGANFRALGGQKEFDVNGDATRAGAITLLPVNRIPVSVHAEFTHPQAQGAGGGVLTAANQISLDLQRQGNGPGTHVQRPSLQDDSGSSSSGISQLVGVSPGKYWVNARAFNGYIASMTSGGVDLLQDSLAVSADGSASPVEVTLRDDVASLSATLASSLLTTAPTGRPTVYLQLIPQSGPGVARAEAFAADGTINLGNVPPGSYLAFASTSRRQIEYRNPAVLVAFAGKGQTVNVEPGGSAHITIDSILETAGETSSGAPGGRP